MNFNKIILIFLTVLLVSSISVIANVEVTAVNEKIIYSFDSDGEYWAYDYNGVLKGVLLFDYLEPSSNAYFKAISWTLSGMNEEQGHKYFKLLSIMSNFLGVNGGITNLPSDIPSLDQFNPDYISEISLEWDNVQYTYSYENGWKYLQGTDPNLNAVYFDDQIDSNYINFHLTNMDKFAGVTYFKLLAGLSKTHLNSLEIKSVSSKGASTLATGTADMAANDALIKIYREYEQMIKTAAATYGVPESLIVAVIYKESGGIEKAVSKAGAAGLMQMVPGTAIDNGLKIQFKDCPNCAQINTFLKTIDNDGASYKPYMDDNNYWIVCYGQGVSLCNSCYPNYCDHQQDERFQPVKNINAGTWHLAKLYSRNGHDWNNALNAYHSKDPSYATDVLRYKSSFEASSGISVTAAPVSPGTATSAAAGEISSLCRSTKCKQIDEVWLQIKQYLNIQDAEIKGLQIWNDRVGWDYTFQQVHQPTTTMTAGTYQWPVRGDLTLNSCFGKRKLAASLCTDGIDIDGIKGKTDVYSITSGIVFRILRDHTGLGNSVLIKHDDGKYSRYSHLDSISVNENQNVGTDTVLGKLGSTGLSTGAHLDLKIYLTRPSGKNGVNPICFFSRDPVKTIVGNCGSEKGRGVYNGDPWKICTTERNTLADDLCPKQSYVE